MKRAKTWALVVMAALMGGSLLISFLCHWLLGPFSSLLSAPLTAVWAVIIAWFVVKRLFDGFRIR